MKEKPIIIDEPFKYMKAVDYHLKKFGHLPSECGGTKEYCPLAKER